MAQEKTHAARTIAMTLNHSFMARTSWSRRDGGEAKGDTGMRPGFGRLAGRGLVAAVGLVLTTSASAGTRKLTADTAAPAATTCASIAWADPDARRRHTPDRNHEGP